MENDLNDLMRLARYDLKQKQTKNWINVKSQSKHSCQSELYEEEKKLMFTRVNNFMTKLIIDKDRLNDSKVYRSVSKEMMILDDFNERIKSVHDIINQLNGLIQIEKSAWLISNNNTPKDKQKLNELKMKINWMEKSIDLAVKRYNEIRIFLNLPMDDLYSEIKNQTKPFKLDYMSKKKRQEIEHKFKFKETELILSDLRSPMELLKNRIVDHGITPTYRFLRRNTSGQQFIYNYSCSLFGMYVEGSGTSKYEAKVNTAAEMLRSIIRKQKNRTLSSHIRAFNDKELKAISPLIKFKANYVEELHNECVKNLYQTPIYTLLSQPKNDYKLVNHYSIQCNAMDLVAIGHSNKRSAAKQTAARNIMSLWEKSNLKSLQVYFHDIFKSTSQELMFLLLL
ncbi:uncharacterized protein LOC112601121 [Melanaphis sacchari]|uniref:uncharacterized protein LOC112601121 n=1 Tax=Melanaphis sacchari TaxID=742174 RepID=UPI000DC149BA|nr:uncharacterized protein LOC112601121 [Melanaphis sacchari]